MYCYLEFKLRYNKNLKLFSIRIRELFEPSVLRRKADGLLLFLKAFSYKTDLRETLCDFRVKNGKLDRKINIKLKLIIYKRNVVTDNQKDFCVFIICITSYDTSVGLCVQQNDKNNF